MRRARGRDARRGRLPGAGLVRACLAPLPATRTSMGPPSGSAAPRIRPSGAFRPRRSGGFDPGVHLRSANASPLTFLSGLLDAERIAGDHEVVVVVASSTGWYTALAASGALEFDDAFRLVQTMALLAEEPIAEDDPGGQLIYALTDSEWRPDPDRTSALEAVLARQTDGVHRSLELGAFSVLSGTDGGIDGVAADLPVSRSAPALPVPRRHAGGMAHPPACRSRGTRCGTLGGPHLVRSECDPGRWARRPLHTMVDRSGRAGEPHHP